MKTYDCVHCGVRLLEVSSGDAVLIGRFPDNLLRCYSMLKLGPGGVICPRCTKPNVLPVPGVAIGPDKHGIIGLPKELSAADVPDQLLHDLAAEAGAVDIVQANSPRDFRRAFITRYIAPAGNLMNSFLVADDSLAWVEEHHGELDAGFWAAMWLTSAGAVQLFTKPLAEGELPWPAFVPHEEAPDAASHLVKLKEAVQLHDLNVGRLIGYLLLWWACRALDARSLQPFVNRLGTLIPEHALQQDTLDAAAAKLGEIVDGFDNQKEGWITNSYLCDAVLALLAHEHELENPRKHQWTRIVLFYDFMRRRDGNDESVLLDPSLLRATVDEPMFWQVCKRIARRFGLMELTAANSKDFGFLFEAASRVFPAEAMTQMSLKVEFRDEDKVIEGSVDMILRHLEEGNLLLVSAVLDGVRMRHPDALPAVSQSVIGKVEAALKLPAEPRCALYRMLIEMLNRVGHHEAAGEVIDACVSFMNSAEGAAIPASRRAQLLNEFGNCMRYEGQREEALEIYEQALELLGGDARDDDVRVGLRNRAIILRELHRYSEAQAAFAALMPHAGMTELRQLVTSQGNCLMEMGLDAEALALLEAHTSLIEGEGLDSNGVIEQITLHAGLLLMQGKLEHARELLDEVRDAAERRHYAAAVILDHMVTLRSHGVQKDRAIDGLFELLSHLQPGQPLGRLVLDAVADLDQAMIEAGREAEAEALVRELCEGTNAKAAPSAWRLYLLAARHAALADDSEGEEEDLLAAMLHYELGLWHIAARDDVLAFTSAHAGPTLELVQRVARRHERGEDPTGLMVRYAADMRAAPVLSARLRHIADLAPPLIDLENEEERLAQLLQRTPAVLLQFVAADGGVLAVRSWLTEEGDIESSMLRLAISYDALAQFANRMSFALLRANPSAAELAMHQVRGWDEATGALRAVTDGMPEQLPLVIAAGPLREPLIALALGMERPLCFVPSISALVSMRTRHAEPPAPRSMFAFAAWFDREREEEAQALARGAQQASAIAERLGLVANSVTGVAATGEALLDGLAAADVAWIACHGRLRPGADGVQLYVAANGSLPPADAMSIREGLRDPHILRWAGLAGMSTASRTVFSSACDSGLAITNPGGERLGLERPLFAAGTSVFVAPMWPVPTAASQRVLAAVLDAWLKEPELPLVQHVWRARKAGAAAGEPALACAAFVPFGDALN
ncbi:MAG TPA: CHAT domain-containing protein [Pseudoduganella sp.]